MPHFDINHYNYLQSQGRRWDAFQYMHNHPAQPVSTPNEINEVADQQKDIRKKILLATNKVIPVTFGRDRFFCKPVFVAERSSYLYIMYLVGEGPIDKYNAFYVDGKTYSEYLNTLKGNGTASLTYYTGEVGQVSDANLRAKFNITSNFPYIAYLVFIAKTSELSSFPRFEVDINGKKITEKATHSVFEVVGATRVRSGANMNRNFITHSNDLSQHSRIGNALSRRSSNTKVGPFYKTEIYAGYNADSFCGTESNRFNPSGIADMYITIYYDFGTSSRFRMEIADKNTSGTNYKGCVASGPKSGDIAQLLINSEIGTVTITENEALNGYNILQFKWTPYLAGQLHDYTISIGPDSAIRNSSIYVYGVQVENRESQNSARSKIFSENPVSVYSSLIDIDDPDGIEKAANWNNHILYGDTAPRRSFGMTFNKPQKLASIAKYVLAHTGCFVTYNKISMYRKKENSYIFHDGNIFAFTFRKKRSRDAPNYSIVEFNNVDNDFKSEEAVASMPELNTSSVSVIKKTSRVNLLGYHTHSMAKREALQRLNLHLSDLTATLTTSDNGVRVDIGDVVTVTYKDIFTRKKFFVNKISSNEAGMWVFELSEYQDNLFSSAVETSPLRRDIELPRIKKPPPVSGIRAQEFVYKRANGKYAHKVTISWTASPESNVIDYLVRLRMGAEVYQQATKETTIDFYRLDAGTYILELSARNDFYSSDPTGGTVDVHKEAIYPPIVTGFAGFEAGYKVFLSWDEAADLDVVGYDIRYIRSSRAVRESLANVSIEDWYRSTAIGTYTELKATIDGGIMGPGTWYFLIRAKDSGDRMSNLPAVTEPIEVTLDDVNTGDILEKSGNFIYDAAKLLDQSKHVLQAPKARFSNEKDIYVKNSTPWSTVFAGKTTFNGEVQAMPYYQSELTENFIIETVAQDLGTEQNSAYRVNFGVTHYKGAQPTKQIGLSTSATGPFIFTTENPTKSTNARYIKARLSGTGIIKFKLNPPTEWLVYKARTTESGESRTNGLGPKRITLENNYRRIKNINVTIAGASPYSAVVDNMTAGTPTYFDVFVFDVNNNQAAAPFYWTFEGVI